MKLICSAPCDTRFDLDLKFPMPMDEFAKRLKAVRCPKCGKGPHGIKIGDPPNPGGTGK